jgi:two-component system chemotaxis response regulator CheB
MNKLSDLEVSLLYKVITRITGTDQDGDSRKDSLVQNVSRLMTGAGCSDLTAYLNLVDKDPRELASFLSAITIHTTSWFREIDHFDVIKEHVLKLIKSGVRFVHVWSAACSSGQEVYSIALCLEQIRQEYPDFDYKVNGTDIDPLSVEAACRGVYPLEELKQIPKNFHSLVLTGKGRLRDFFTIRKTVRNKCRFSVENLDREQYHQYLSDFDIVLCRNVLIYFHPRQGRKIVDRLKQCLKPGGLLVLGHSEFINEYIFGLKSIGHSSYQKIRDAGKGSVSQFQLHKKTILVVEDAPVIRTVLRANLLKNGFNVLEAENADEAQKMLNSNNVDLISLDLNMPGKNGAEWLREIRAKSIRIPVVVVSASSAADAELVYGALGSGAQEYIEKEVLGKNIQKFTDTINSILNSSKDSNFNFRGPKEISIDTPKVIMIGASTGGPDAIWKLLKSFPKPTPPIVVVQHTNSFYAEHFAKTVAKISGLETSGEKDGELLRANHVYIARGDYHLSIEQRGSEIYLRHLATAAVLGHRPSVDVLFTSAVHVSGSKVAILLTGMGTDGASAMKALADAGSCFNLAQSENSCVVFGMPKEAISLGAVHFTGNIADIRAKLESLITGKIKKAV